MRVSLRGFPCLIAVSLITGGFFQDLSACRYNVRETGFVDFGIDDYTLLLRTEEGASTDEIARLESEVAAGLTDSNVSFRIIDADTELSSLLPSTVETGAGTMNHFRATLLSPTGSLLGLAGNLETASNSKSLAQLLGEVVSSPIRNEFTRRIVAEYAVILLIDGLELERNGEAYQHASSAVDAIGKRLKYMPKPIEHGPSILRMSADAAKEERILLWSLGLHDTDFTVPHAAVLYGKGRWIGPVLAGDEITEEALSRILSVVGADCECGLDTRLLRGTMLPVFWNSETRAQVAKNLGFDPENPMVTAEVSRILKMRTLLWPEHPASRSTTADFDDLPVPFVDDIEAQEQQAFGLGSMAYMAGAMALLVIGIGIGVLVVSFRKGP